MLRVGGGRMEILRERKCRECQIVFVLVRVLKLRSLLSRSSACCMCLYGSQFSEGYAVCVRWRALRGTNYSAGERVCPDWRETGVCCETTWV